MPAHSMGIRTVITIASVTATVVSLLGVPARLSDIVRAESVSRENNTPLELPEVPRETLDHRLETWLSALEWCESQGNGDAVNPNDLDGTPSYYWYQFKPGTFHGFGIQYGLLASTTPLEGILEREMRDYALTRDIVRHMAEDPKVNLWGQFPGCMAKIGAPSRTSKTAVCEADCPLIDPESEPGAI